MSANFLSLIMVIIGILALLGGGIIPGITLLSSGIFVWWKNPDEDTISAWIFAAAIIGVIGHWMFGGSSPS